MSVSEVFKPTLDLPSPRDLIPKSDIAYSKGKVEIKHLKPNIWLTDVADTNSMDPTVDAGHTCILTDNFKHEDLVVGDVVVYSTGTQNIMHRIIKIEQDTQGRKYTLKGDNNYRKDPYAIKESTLRTT